MIDRGDGHQQAFELQIGDVHWFAPIMTPSQRQAAARPHKLAESRSDGLTALERGTLLSRCGQDSTAHPKRIACVDG